MERNEIYTNELRNFRYRNGLTVPQYAVLLGASLRSIYRWVAGSPIDPLLWMEVARVHGVDPRRPEALGFRLAGKPPTENSVTDDSEVNVMIRRDFFGVTAGVFFASELDERVATLFHPKSAVRVGESDVAKVTETHRHLHTAGRLMGGGALGVERLQRESWNGMELLAGFYPSEKVRRQAHTAVAGLSNTVGWELFDLGHQDKARRAFVQALAVVRNAEPEHRTQIQTYVLGNMAAQLRFLGRPQKALDLLAMVNGREHKISSLLRAFLASERAMATAALGNAEETRKHIGWAEEHINDMPDDRDQVWNVNDWFHPGLLSGSAGHAFASLAVSYQPYRDTSIDEMKRAIAEFPSTQVRNRARMQNSLTRLYAVSGDARATVDAGMEAVASARRLQSPWVIRDLGRVRRELLPLSAKRGVRDLSHEIDALVKGITDVG